MFSCFFKTRQFVGWALAQQAVANCWAKAQPTAATLLLTVLVATTVNAWAETTNDDPLYTAYLPVISQDVDAQTALLPQALTQVLIKVSGNPEVGKIPFIQAQLPEAASKLLLSYRYDTIESGSLPGNPRFEWVVTFDAAQVERLLKSAHQAIWTRKRPTTLVWLIRVGETGKQWVNGNEPNSVVAMLEETARQRGIPLLFPLYDLTDLADVSLEDVWTPDLNVVQAASERYASDAVFIGKLLPHPDSTPDVPRWQGQWVFLQDGNKVAWQTTGMDPEQVANRAINELADLLAKRYAKASLSTKKIEPVLVSVHGLRSVEDFTNTNLYLKKLAVVEKLVVVSINEHEVAFELAVAGGAGALASALGADRRLLPEGTVSQTSQGLPHLTYRLAS